MEGIALNEVFVLDFFLVSFSHQPSPKSHDFLPYIYIKVIKILLVSYY